MGDPVSLNKWEEPEMSIRRSYRGMLYKIVNGAKETFVDSEGVTRIRYYSQGVADASAIPAAEESTHDFIIASLSASLTTGENCVTQSVMLRTDSNVLGAPGSMFAGMPNDFICFNSEDILDEFDDTKFGADNFCPYDPTDPPVTAHNISGTILVESANTDYLDTITVNTSDGEGNCSLGSFAPVSGIYTASYGCTVFDWGTGWEGYIETKGQIDKVACNPSRNTYTGVNSSIANESLNCIIGNIVVVQGTITGPYTVALTSATISDGGICEIAGDGASYTCQSDVFLTSAWSGSVTFTNTGVLCPATGLDESTGKATYTNILPDFYDLNMTIAENTSQC